MTTDTAKTVSQNHPLSALFQLLSGIWDEAEFSQRKAEILDRIARAECRELLPCHTVTGLRDLARQPFKAKRGTLSTPGKMAHMILKIIQDSEKRGQCF